jgi:hypothetical protein
MSFNIKSLCLIGFLVVMTATCLAAELPSPSSEPGPDPAKLVGRWLRADGGYLLQLTEPGPDGQLQAAYFNPRPINVARAAWKHQDGYLGAFVELRAPNYPGSTYTLAYDPTQDRLVGLYFQAAMQEQFDVEFKRTP